MGKMTIENRKSGKREHISSEDWEMLKEKDLETAGRGKKYSSLFKVIDFDGSSPLDEKQSAEDANVPEVLKVAAKNNPVKEKTT